MEEDGFEEMKMDKWTQHEGLDRVSILLSQIDTCFGYYEEELSHEENKDNIHPSIWNEECGHLLKQAYSSLCQLYQKIGEWEEDEE